ncbi:MAG: hypothetical protein LBB90_03425 [Tannerella sp.]|nr:hypothetical protein [Tannerella sp.]
MENAVFDKRLLNTSGNGVSRRPSKILINVSGGGIFLLTTTDKNIPLSFFTFFSSGQAHGMPDSLSDSAEGVCGLSRDLGELQGDRSDLSGRLSDLPGASFNYSGALFNYSEISFNYLGALFDYSEISFNYSGALFDYSEISFNYSGALFNYSEISFNYSGALFNYSETSFNYSGTSLGMSGSLSGMSGDAAEMRPGVRNRPCGLCGASARRTDAFSLPERKCHKQPRRKAGWYVRAATVFGCRLVNLQRCGAVECVTALLAPFRDGVGAERGAMPVTAAPDGTGLPAGKRVSNARKTALRAFVREYLSCKPYVLF